MSEEEFISNRGRILQGGREIPGSRLFRREIPEEKNLREIRDAISQSIGFQTVQNVEAGIQEASGVISSNVGAVLNPLREERKESGNPLNVVQDPGFSINPEDVRDPNPGNLFSFADDFIPSSIRMAVLTAIRNSSIPDITRGDVARIIGAAPAPVREAAIQALQGIGGITGANTEDMALWFGNQFVGGVFEVAKNLTASRIEQSDLLGGGGGGGGAGIDIRDARGLLPSSIGGDFLFGSSSKKQPRLPGEQTPELTPSELNLLFGDQSGIDPSEIDLLESDRRIFPPPGADPSLFDFSDADIDGNDVLSPTEIALALAGDQITSSINALHPLILNLQKDPNFLRRKIPMEQLRGEDPRVRSNQVSLIQQANAGFLDDLNLFNTVF